MVISKRHPHLRRAQLIKRSYEIRANRTLSAVSASKRNGRKPINPPMR